jgi:hypothetical protein
MPNDDQNATHKMNKRVEAKEDGRVIIFYTFESSSGQADSEAACDKDQRLKDSADKAD